MSVLSLVTNYFGCLSVFFGDTELLNSMDFCCERRIYLFGKGNDKIILFGRLL